MADYTFGSLEGWDAFTVIRFHAVEELSKPFEYEIALLRDAALGPVDLDGLLDTGATLRIATETRSRAVHGVIAEAEEIDRTATALLYRVLLVPHFARSKNRRACRSFVPYTTVQKALSLMLENRPPDNPSGADGLIPFDGNATSPDPDPDLSAFVEPKGAYRLLLAESDGLVDDETYRKFIVQYNESEFDFVSRLLQEEGLTYLFEHTVDTCVLTITDRPGSAALFDRAEVFSLHGAATFGQGRVANVNRAPESVLSLTSARRSRSRAVRIRDWSGSEPLNEQETKVAATRSAPAAAEHGEYPGTEDEDSFAARVLERFEAERAMLAGRGTVRRLEPGAVCTIQDADALRDDAQVLVVRVDTFASQVAISGTPLDQEHFGFGSSPQVAPAFESRFVGMPAALRFRPARTTPRPTIAGVIQAVVTAGSSSLPSCLTSTSTKRAGSDCAFPGISVRSSRGYQARIACASPTIGLA